MRKIKVLSVLFIALMFVLCLTACGNSSGDADGGSSSAASGETTDVSDKESSADSSKASSASGSDSKKQSSGKSETSKKTQKEIIEESWKPVVVPDPEPQKQDPPKSNKLVVYFSASNKTEKVAKTLSKAVNADICEIVPKKPYQVGDLNTHDSESRCCKEMSDPDCRPELFEKIKYFDKYDIIYLGYPIWFGEAPRIVSTFVESHNFKDKTIIPFCTSSTTPIGDSAKKLEKQAGGGKWLQGKRLEVNAKGAELKKWSEGLLK